MSKKQREKVEDEVRYFQEKMRTQADAAPDSVYDTQQQTPSSSDQYHGHYRSAILDILIFYFLFVYRFIREIKRE